jgi:hygromycin-B 7''-O-kinase
VLPDNLVAQIRPFLLPLDELIDQNLTPHLIHADLTKDHILGELNADRWVTNAIIDFGDAMLGDFTYELIALHLDLFDCDKRLLDAYLHAYGLDEKTCQMLPIRAMNLTLLHRFDVLKPICQRFPRVKSVTTLEQLADLLWDTKIPGL